MPSTPASCGPRLDGRPSTKTSAPDSPRRSSGTATTSLGGPRQRNAQSRPTCVWAAEHELSPSNPYAAPVRLRQDRPLVGSTTAAGTFERGGSARWRSHACRIASLSMLSRQRCRAGLAGFGMALGASGGPRRDKRRMQRGHRRCHASPRAAVPPRRAAEDQRSATGRRGPAQRPSAHTRSRARPSRGCQQPGRSPEDPW